MLLLFILAQIIEGHIFTYFIHIKLENYLFSTKTFILDVYFLF